jgi:hypothetical protein
MANNNAANVSVGKPVAGGAIFVAPKGTALPDDAVTPLNAAFKNVGYASEDGLTNPVETDQESVKAWGGDEVLTTQTSRTESFTFTAIETNEVSLKEVFGETNVTVDGDGITVLHNSKERIERIYVFEIAMTGGRIKRILVPAAKVSEVGEITYKDGEPIGYPITLSALPDADGNTAYEFLAEAA